ncbi:DUF418 domain-containing protein [Aliikangiella maris]|uniref:DUF418 domain-containing protein n=2 Tax=Aliikangiella maris TaxID=3162458 RepID=A0ABV2BUP2_9GAMM
MNTHNSLQTPTAANQRILSLDIIRGICLCGILFANLMSFTGFYSLNLLQITQLPWQDRTTLFFIDWLIEGKFYAMFSILFGIGFAVQWHRFLPQQQQFKNYWLRRMSILLIIGVMHLCFIWHGDILTLYSLLGFALLYFANLSQSRLLKIILLLFMLPILIHWVLVISAQHSFWSSLSVISQAVKVFWGYADVSLLQMRTSSNPTDVFYANLLSVIPRPMSYLQTGRIPEVFAYFLTGLFLARQYLLTENAPTNRTINLPILSGLLLLGLILSLIYAYIKAVTGTPFATNLIGFFQGVCYHVGAILLALAFMGFLFTIKIPNKILTKFALLGRCSLTVYLMQTSVCVFIFYGYGFALMGKVAFSSILAFALMILIVQYYFCKVWLNYFSQGPMEFIWRKLAYLTFNNTRYCAEKIRRPS